MTGSIVYNREAQKGSGSRWVGLPVYHKIIQESILVHWLWLTKNSQRQNWWYTRNHRNQIILSLRKLWQRVTTNNILLLPFTCCTQGP